MIANTVGDATSAAASFAFQSGPSRRDLIDAVKAISATDIVGNRDELTFVFDRASQEAIVKVIDRQTNEVIMQVPAAYLLALAKALKQPRS